MDLNPTLYPPGQIPHAHGRRSTPRQVFGWIVTLVGVALVILGADEIRRVLPTLSWASTGGRVDSARVSLDTVGRALARYRPRPIVEPRFHVAYRYNVGGTEYVGRRVDPLPETRRDPEVDLRRYPAGGAVTVYYDPAVPANAVLETPRPVLAWLIAGGGLALLIAGRRLTRRRVKHPPIDS